MIHPNSPKRRITNAILYVVTAATVAFGSTSYCRAQDRQLTQTGSANAPSSKRLALVIGNGAYTNAPPLKNPPNDARDMAATLRALGFDVTSGINANQRDMKRLIREFGQKLKGGGSGLFYYAGHGVQSKGRNYLIPVDADIQSEVEAEDAGVDVGLVLGYMDDAQNGLNIVILDACRNNPFARSMRSAESGLAQVDAPTGTLIAYSTAPGRVAADGAGQNGLYTAELLKQMKVPGLSVTEMFMQVRAEVVKQTNGKQVPWEASSLIGSFSFNAAANSTVSAANNAGAPRKPVVAIADAGTVEAEYWETIKNSTAAADYQEYLKEYPQGRYAQLARLKLRQIETDKGDRSKSNVLVGQPTGGNTPSNTMSVMKAAPRAGAIVRNQMGMELVYIPPGTFMMGSPESESERGSNEGPRHQVTIGEEYYIGRYEVTQAQWKQVMGSVPSRFRGCDQCPVENVSWNEVQEFLRTLNLRNDGYTYRLPSEAEWEYACRAGTTTAFAFGDSLSSELANFNGKVPYGGATKGNWRDKTMPVGRFSPNAWGLYDMHGNVLEWCEDWYHDSYDGGPADGSAWLNGGEQKERVLRGGSWNYYGVWLRSAYRDKFAPTFKGGVFGFRVVAILRY